MRTTMQSFYDSKKIKILSQYILDDNVDNYIKPVKNKNTGEIHDYIIRIGTRKLTLRSTTYSLDDKYNKFKYLLIEAKKISTNIN